MSKLNSARESNISEQTLQRLKFVFFCIYIAQSVHCSLLLSTTILLLLLSSLSLSLPLCLSASLSLCLSVSLPLCLSVSLSLCLSVSLSLCLSLSLSALSLDSATEPFGCQCARNKPKEIQLTPWPTTLCKAMQSTIHRWLFSPQDHGTIFWIF